MRKIYNTTYESEHVNNLTETFGKVQVMKIIKFLMDIKVINVQLKTL